MAGPWEDYAPQAERGPWEDYRQPAPAAEQQQSTQPAQEPSTFQKFAVGASKALEASGALPEGNTLTGIAKNIKKSFTDQPSEEERLTEAFRPVFGEGGRALARPLSAANAAFGAISAVMPKGVNEAVSKVSSGMSDLIKPALKAGLPPFMRGEDIDPIIEEIAPLIGSGIAFSTLAHGLRGRAAEPTMAPAPEIMGPPKPPVSETTVPQQPQVSSPPTAPAAVETPVPPRTPAAAPPVHPMGDLRFQLEQPPASAAEKPMPVTAEATPVPGAVQVKQEVQESIRPDVGVRIREKPESETIGSIGMTVGKSDVLVLKSALEKIKAGKPLTSEEAFQLKERRSLWKYDPTAPSPKPASDIRIPAGKDLRPAIQMEDGRILTGEKGQPHISLATKLSDEEIGQVNESGWVDRAGKFQRSVFDTPESRAAHTKVAEFAAQTVARMPEETKGMTPEQKIAWLDDQLIKAASERVDTEKAAAGEARATEMQRGAVTLPEARGISAWLDRSLNAKELTKDIIREQTGEKAAKLEQARYALKAEETRWKGASTADSLNFIDAFETGNLARIRPEDQPIAATLRDRFDQVRTDIQNLGTGKLEHFYENYYRHLFEQPGGIERLKGMIFGKRPLAGAAGALKYRSVPLMRDAVSWKVFSQQGDFLRAFPDEMTARGAASLVPDAQVVEPWKPVTWNPVTNFLLHLGEMEKYKAAHIMKDNMIDAGTAAFVRFGNKPPEGWRPLDDKIFRVLQYSPEEKGFVIRGQYYAPPEAAKAFNNYLSPGLKGNWAFDAARAAGITMNQAQLGLSFFHAGFTTLETGVSDLALSIQKFSRGDILGGSKAALRSLSGYSWLDNPMTGYKVLRNYLEPGSYPEYDRTVALMKSSGGRPFQAEHFTNQAIRALEKGWQEKDALLMARKLFPAALEYAAKPVMEKLVPWQKLGAFARLTEDVIGRADREGWNADQIRHEGGKLWDTVDDRLGQMVYDNVTAVNKVVKDLAFVGVRSVGWNFGDVRQFGGGLAVDLPRELLRAATGRGFEVTPRMAYALALPIYAGWVGAITTIGLTGRFPESVTDLYYPPTGRTDESGKPERVNLPTYMKDIIGAKTHPVRMAVNKLHPLLNGIAQMLENKDFNETQIRDPQDPVHQQILQSAEFIAKQFLPFSVRAAMQRAMTSGQATGADIFSQLAGAAKISSLPATALSIVGIQPAPRSATGSPAERLVSEYSQMRLPREVSQIQRQQSLEARQLMQRFKTGEAKMNDVQQAVRAGKLTQEHFDRMIANEQLPYLVRGIKGFQLHEALNVWQVADDKEKMQIRNTILNKEHLLQNYPVENRQQMQRQLQQIQTWYPGKKAVNQ